MLKKGFSLVTLLLGISITVTAQEQLKQYVQQNAVEVKTIHPDSTDNADLEAIGNAIGNAKIVMLGEQDHGDAPTFLAKTRLIKYLHEKKGFNVIAFESDFFGLNEGWRQLPKQKNYIDSFLSGNVFGIWSGCDACTSLLYNYIPNSFQTDHPLQVTGFDSQQILSYSNRKLTKALDSVIKALELPLATSPEYQPGILHTIDTIAHSYNLPSDTVSFNKRAYYLQLLKDQLLAKLPADNFWVMVADNLIYSNIQYSKRREYSVYMNARDGQMGRNLQWLSRVKYPNEKIIVWAHNFHVSKYSGHYPENFLNDVMAMGSVFTNDAELMKQTYILGFTSYEGEAGRITMRKYAVEKPTSNSFENWINKSYNYAFVDFSQYNNRYPGAKDAFYMKGSIKAPYHRNHKAVWSRIFDAVFFVRTMYPCKMVKHNNTN